MEGPLHRWGPFPARRLPGSGHSMNRKDATAGMYGLTEEGHVELTEKGILQCKVP